MTASMDALITFLRARLDEDERWARAAAADVGATWNPSGGYPETGPLLVTSAKDHERVIVDETADVVMHIARHDPARVLADVAAKRQIIELVIGAYAGYAVLPLLALPFDGHPDYREDWRVQ